MNVENLQLLFVKGGDKAFLKNVPALTAFANIVSIDGAYYNDYLDVPFVETGSTSVNFDYATGVAENPTSIRGNKVLLSGWKQQIWGIKDSEWPRLNEETVMNIGRVKVNALFSDVSNDIFSNVSASFNNFTVASGSSWGTMQAVAQLEYSAAYNNWGTDKSLIVGPSIKSAMLGSALGQNVLNAAALAYAIGDNKTIREGELGSWVGFDVVPTSRETLPSTIYGMATTPSAAAVGLAYAKPSEFHQYIKADKVEDPTTKLVYGTRIYYSRKYYTTMFVTEVLYGSLVLNPKGAFNLLVTDITK